MQTDLTGWVVWKLQFAAAPLMTREVFGNIPESSQRIFYGIACLSLLVFGGGVFRRIRYWKMGKPSTSSFSWRALVRRFIKEIITQKRVLGRKTVGIAHVLLFSGFVILGMGTTLIGIEHWSADLLGREADQPVFHFGWYYLIYEFVLDTFGLALLIGCVLFMKRRWSRPSSLGHHPSDWIVLISFLCIGVSGYLVESLRILHHPSPADAASFIGRTGAMFLSSLNVDSASAGKLHFGIWWGHSLLSFSFIAGFPFTRLFHAIAGMVNILCWDKEMGSMTPITLEELEETGKTGVETPGDFTRRQLIELDSCVSCGRCEEACPAFEAGKPLSPKKLVQDIRATVPTAYESVNLKEGNGHPPCIAGNAVKDETLWSCTTCSACVQVCPLNVNPLGMITDLRRFLIGEGKLRGSAANALQKIQLSGNPWGMPQQERFHWAEGLEVPTAKDNPKFEVLYWVGCAASYDRRVSKVARAMVQLMKTAKVNFAVLGKEERCNGESSRRMGDEFAFQESALGNIETLTRYQVKKIVTHCPHCLNTFQKDYPQFGGEYEVVHHSVFLDELVASGKLRVPNSPSETQNKTTGYHDPCYLARVNGITEEPRKLLKIKTSEKNGNDCGVIELPRNRKQTACCGAGGGRMWFDDSPEQRIGGSRCREVNETGVDQLGTSCPFCLIMMKDGLASIDSEVVVKDVAEILLEKVSNDSADAQP
ncbi:MAG TPA: 4Fe-4S dicluster domain-containing protein [Verrucomicrobiales bacterium]|nr:4Fe-4S dicluster domain-containing protein [Verrucomicrobiales bacterium]